MDRLSESKDDFMWQSMMVGDTNYKYDRIKRPWELENTVLVKEVAKGKDPGNPKQRLPKNLLAVEMAVENKKQMDQGKNMQPV